MTFQQTPPKLDIRPGQGRP